jgi:hypothetical protein
MPCVLYYADLEINRVDALLSNEGELFVSLPQKHAKALVSFIETIRVVQSWRAQQTPVLKRLPFLAKGLWLTASVAVMQPRLFELGRVVVLSSRSQTWEQQVAGDVLFTFKS